MKVVHISTAKTWRGGEQQLAYLYDELHKKNTEQLVVCAAESALHHHCTAEKYHYKTLSKKWNFDVLYAYNLSQHIKQFQADIVHTHDAHAHTLALLAKSLFGFNAKLVVSRRVDFPVGNNFLSSWKYNSRHVSHIICVSEAIKKIMLQNVSQHKLSVIHSGIDCGRFKAPTGILRKAFNISDTTLIVANVAALVPHKDYFTFLDTVKILKEKYKLNAKYFIIGDGEMKTAIAEKTKLLQLENDVIMTGFRNDTNSIFSEIDILLFTSETEGLGTTVLDAFCCGVPVAATNAGGISELVVHEKTGMLANVKDAATLASNVSQLVENNVLRNSIISEAKRKVLSFSKQATAEKTLRIYTQVLKT